MHPVYQHFPAMTVFFGFSTELMNSVREELLHFFQRNKR